MTDENSLTEGLDRLSLVESLTEARVYQTELQAVLLVVQGQNSILRMENAALRCKVKQLQSKIVKLRTAWSKSMERLGEARIKARLRYHRIEVLEEKVYGPRRRRRSSTMKPTLSGRLLRAYFAFRSD